MSAVLNSVLSALPDRMCPDQAYLLSPAATTPSRRGAATTHMRLSPALLRQCLPSARCAAAPTMPWGHSGACACSSSPLAPPPRCLHNFAFCEKAVLSVRVHSSVNESRIMVAQPLTCLIRSQICLVIAQHALRYLMKQSKDTINSLLGACPCLPLPIMLLCDHQHCCGWDTSFASGCVVPPASSPWSQDG